jgi:hypothetical protein
MPDVRDLVIGTTTVGANYEKFVKAQSDVGKEIIISATKAGGLEHDDLLAVYNQLTLAGGTPGYNAPDLDGPDAFTLSSVGLATAGSTFVSGTTTTVFFKAQGTGTPLLTDVSGVTLAVVAVFEPAK